ncbi:unnamed protein product [Dibothriocephalus latus]|uniref:Uncharacterized protein n=1 Tax=Dibothriocephalus latus TaxID=60516 RepID=A0A3P7NGA0_DIBLA|nr:unnamed protein product [Dibothriocephalus latus]
MAYSKEQQVRAEQHSQMERGIGLPPVPKVHMGACFSLIFEGCPLKVNATATWVNPSTNALERPFSGHSLVNLA